MHKEKEGIIAIRIGDLRKMGACEDGIERFENIFPRGVRFVWCAETQALLGWILPFAWLTWFMEKPELWDWDCCFWRKCSPPEIPTGVFTPLP